jgi:steroid delta-isomerase-like uncharacterized protein
MTLEANAELGRRFFQSQDRLKGGPDPDLCSQDYSIEIAGFPPMPREGHEQFAKGFFAAFPDLYHTVDKVIANDEGMAVRFTLRGTHKAEFMGIPPTKKAVEVSAIALMSVRDGRVSQVQGIFDQMGMMRQLGVIPSP